MAREKNQAFLRVLEVRVHEFPVYIYKCIYNIYSVYIYIYIYYVCVCMYIYIYDLYVYIWMYNIEDPDPKAIDFLETSTWWKELPSEAWLLQVGTPGTCHRGHPIWNVGLKPLAKGEPFTQVVAMRKRGKKEQLWILSLGIRALSCRKAWCLDHHLGIYEAAIRRFSKVLLLKSLEIDLRALLWLRVSACCCIR